MYMQTNKTSGYDPLDNLSPLDSRYRVLNPGLFDAIASYLSESATIDYYGYFENALAHTLSEFGIAPPEFGSAVEAAVSELSLREVYEEERKIQHNIRALVNCIQAKLPPTFKPFVHLFATSADAMDSARAVQYRQFTDNVLIPSVTKCVDLLYRHADQYGSTVQIGRTHGRHAEPTTFGYVLAHHAVRLHGRLNTLDRASRQLIGKMSGAVGTRAALKLGVEDPREFENAVMRRLGISAGPKNVSTQIVQPEPMLDFMHAIVSLFGVLASIADDYRHLMRSEISEIEETEVSARVGSSTMPHKINPKDFENVKSFWKAFMPRMITCYMDQISEHQRDLTNSASQRFCNEVLAALTFSLDRLHTAISGTVVSTRAMDRNLQLGLRHGVGSEALYIGLALSGVPDAHEAIRRLAVSKQGKESDILSLAANDKKLAPHIKNLPNKVIAATKSPAEYVGDAPAVSQEVVRNWQQEKAKWSFVVRERSEKPDASKADQRGNVHVTRSS